MRSLPALLAALALADSALAQTPGTPVAPGPPATSELVRMQFPNTDITDILRLYERLTGQRLVYDNTVTGPLNIVIAQPVPKEDAIRIIETNLLLNGFVLVPAGDDIVKVVGLSKNARSTGVPIYSTPDPIPDGARVISYLFKLRYADPVELQQILTPYIPASPNYTAIVALPKASALLVTESTDVLEGLRRIIDEIDVPPAEVISEFIVLDRADATDVLEKLNAIFEQAQPGVPGQPARVRVANNPPISPDQPDSPPVTSVTIEPGTLTEDSIVVGKIKLTADERTNRIHVVTRPVNLPFIRKLIGEFDTSTKFAEPAKRPLKFVPAQEILPVIVQALTEKGQKADQTTTPGGTGAPGQRTAQQGGNRSLGGGGGGGGGDGIDISEGLSTDPIETAPEAATIGNSRIIADNRANAIIVIGTEEVKTKVFQLLDELDVRPPQVMLNTVIGELEIGENQEFGIDYLLRFTGGSNSILQPVTPGTPGTPVDPGIPVIPGTPTVPITPMETVFRGGVAGVSRNTSAPLLEAAGLGSAAAFGGVGNGLTAFLAATDSLDTIVRALESTRKFRVTSRPMVFTSNSKKAIIVSGQEIAVPTQTLSSLDGVNQNRNASVSSNVQFKRVALQLEVVPLINSDREVSLDILQKVDSVVPGSATVVGGNSIPTIATRYIRTNVSVANQATLVLGGLISSEESRGQSGIPILGRIPIIKYLFSTTTKAKTRRELIVLIRPVVTTSPVETVLAKEMEQDRLLLDPDLESTLDAPRSDPRNKFLVRPNVPLRAQ